jgi:hypothetical protein
MDTGEKIFIGLLSLICVLLMAALGMSVGASGTADFCYVGTTQGGHGMLYEAEAHRPWRADLTLGYSTSLDGAVEIARKAGCTTLFTGGKP